MNGFLDTPLHDLNDCGCCDGLTPLVPVEIDNRPGLSALAYRVGTYHEFKTSLLARLSSSPILAERFRTRQDHDFSIALLDSWSIVADVLTFYSQYFANQSYLRTADEQASLRELAKLIGYKPRPGVAATTHLAFTLDDLPGSPEQVTIGIGTKVQSTPGPGETAQIFETVETCEARRAWNAIRPRLTNEQVLKSSTTKIVLQGVLSRLSPGAGVLFTPTGKEDPVFTIVRQVDTDQTRKVTRLTLESPLQITLHKSALNPPTHQSPVLAQPFRDLRDEFLDEEESVAVGEDLETRADARGVEVNQLFDALRVHPPLPEHVMVFYQKAAIFGHNAPAWETLPESLRGEENFLHGKGPFLNDERVWPGGESGHLQILNGDECPTGPPVFSVHVVMDFPSGGSPGGAGGPGGSTNVAGSSGGSPGGGAAPGGLINVGGPSGGSSGGGTLKNPEPARVYLDTVYPEVRSKSYVVLQDENKRGIYEVQKVTELTKSCFTISAKVARLDLDSHDDFEKFFIRSTTVFAQSEWVPLAPAIDESSLSGETFELDGWVAGLQRGQRVVLSGQEQGGSETRVAEFLTIDRVEHDLRFDGRTILTFTTPPARQYLRQTMTLNANVAFATHGETVQEVLGSGNATQPYQSFALRQPPVTHVPAPTANGGASTLEVRVNDIRWHEVPFLFGRQAKDRVFVTETTETGETIVKFGNGQTGSLLPTGQDNVRAFYRRGLGLDGVVKAGQLNTLLTRPLGLKDGINPLPSEGGDDPEPLEDTRTNAPSTVLTLDRTVSLLDYEDFARAYQGIAKAQAVWLWDGTQRVIFITVAGPNGATIGDESSLYEALSNSLQRAGDPFVKMVVKSYRLAQFTVKATIKVHEDFLEDKVLQDVTATLRDAFRFERRSFGQPVSRSEVISVMHQVPGVLAVDVDGFHAGQGKSSSSATKKQSKTGLKKNGILLPAPPSVKKDGTLLSAELLTLNPNSLSIGVMA